MHNIMKSRTNKSIPQKVSRSLNISLRTKKQRQISIDNLGLMQRLQSKKSFYGYRKLATDRSTKNKIASNSKNKLLSNDNSGYLRNLGSLSAHRPVKLSPINLEFKNIVYKSDVNLNNRAFTVEISKGRKIIRMLVTDESGENYSLELKIREALKLMNGEENWPKLLKCLHIDGSGIALLESSSSETITDIQ